MLDNIDSANFSFACACAEKNETVCFFEIDNKIVNRPSVQKYLKNFSFIDLSKVIFDYELFMKSLACAQTNLDTIFEKYFKKTPSISVAKKLYNYPGIEDLYKKEVLLQLNDIYYIHFRINTYIEGYRGQVEYFPSENIEIHFDSNSPLSEKVKVKTHPKFRIAINTYSKKVIEIVNFFYPLYILLKKVKWISFGKNTKKKYLLGINTNLPGLLTWNYHYIEYLIDESYGIRMNEVLFVDETYQKEIPAEFVDTGFEYFNFLTKREIISLEYLFKVFWFFLPSWFRCFFHSFFENRHMVKVSRLMLSDYIRWNLLMDIAEIQNHVTILLPDRISKNLIFSQHGTRTWYIYPDNYAGDYHTGWDENIRIAGIYSFIHADFAVVFGDKIKRYFSNHRNRFKNYFTVGVLASQRVREIREGTLPSKVEMLIKTKKGAHPIIGIFDTTFVDYGPVKIKDGVQFGNDILKLLNDFPEIFVIFKEKKQRRHVKGLVSVYTQIEQHPRCLTILKDEKDCFFSSDVIAYSDLVISAAYSSTAAEAWGIKTKAIYYDIAGTDLGEQYYFNKFPNLVAHDYDELVKLVRYWLYEISNDEYENYFKKYVQGEIDPYLDGNAITRLHKLLRMT